MEERIFIREKPELQSQVQRVFPCNKSGLRKTMQNSFALTVGDGEKRFLLSVTKLLLLTRLNSRADSSGAEYDLLQHRTCTSVPGELAKELSYA